MTSIESHSDGSGVQQGSIRVLHIVPELQIFGNWSIHFDQMGWHTVPTRVLKDVPPSFQAEDDVDYFIACEANWKVEAFRIARSAGTENADNFELVTENCSVHLL